MNMTVGKWSHIQSLRCECREAVLEEVPGYANCTRCKTCGGWFALRINSLTDLDKFRECFAQAAEVPRD